MGKGQSFPVKLSSPSPFSSAFLSTDCSNPIYGQTLNPLNLKKTPGGSSGGEGALLGKGGSILGMGTDTAGSIRIPASYCGVCGLRTTGYRLRYAEMVLVGREAQSSLEEVEVCGSRGACSTHQLLFTQLSTRGSG